MARAPYRLPLPLSGSSDPGAYVGAEEVQPIAQWMEFPRQSAALQVVGVPFSTAGMNYSTPGAAGTLYDFWFRRDSGSTLSTLTARLYVNGVDTGKVLTLGSGVTTAQMDPDVTVGAGNVIRVDVTAGNRSSTVSGMLRLSSTVGFVLYRLLPSPVGQTWVMSDGQWTLVDAVYVKTGSGWVESDGEYIRSGGLWAT